MTVLRVMKAASLQFSSSVFLNLAPVSFYVRIFEGNHATLVYTTDIASQSVRTGISDQESSKKLSNVLTACEQA